ncbi:hypothetical protein [Erythrobacter aureus]|uniref:Uncharacterized protein n=1 Tax=Erythrobacter aureus TaxID=2182384 RepID=A0A345YII9_9SPHN|nr:hypothetical protein [Erythrobacter aureus]AXK43741.1 hypothetical protein DVR09_14890 [Erythrobacter aureus]
MPKQPIQGARHNAILAGLRLLLEHGDRLPPAIKDIATNGGTQEMITPKAVDELCEQINTEGLTLGSDD